MLKMEVPKVVCLIWYLCDVPLISATDECFQFLLPGTIDIKIGSGFLTTCSPCLGLCNKVIHFGHGRTIISGLLARSSTLHMSLTVASSSADPASSFLNLWALLKPAL